MNTTILLTCTVHTKPYISWLNQRNSNERLRLYLTKIKKWLEHTSLNIVVIENSGINLGEQLKTIHPELDLTKYLHRFESITFDYNTIPLHGS